MKFILSPARHMKDTAADITCTTPVFLREAGVVADKLKALAPWELESILRTNEKIALKAFTDIQDYTSGAAVTPAMFAYNGLVYKHLSPASLSKGTVLRSQHTMRIISAFYGLLGPLDGIQPYRLEMQSRLSIGGKNLYAFWGDKVYRELFRDRGCVINLASEEYAKAVRKYLAPVDLFIDIVFYGAVKGRRKVVTTAAKTARGLMARYILENGIDRPEALKDFNLGGFVYAKSLSSHRRYVFGC